MQVLVYFSPHFDIAFSFIVEVYMRALFIKTRFSKTNPKEEMVILKFPECNQGCEQCGKALQLPSTIFGFGFVLVPSQQNDHDGTEAAPSSSNDSKFNTRSVKGV